MTGRRVKEWQGRTPDSKVPPHVRARIFDANGGVCHISGVKIMPGDEWDLDHVKRLADGGENRETNLKPALRLNHREKTAEETRRGRKADRSRRAHIGAELPKAPIPSRGFPQSGKSPRIEKHSTSHLLTPLQKAYLETRE